MSDFFALEAGEYLERLDGLLAKGDNPGADEIVRLARALRGSALMASQHAIARTAGGLEALPRAVREGRPAWDPPNQQPYLTLSPHTPPIIPPHVSPPQPTTAPLS